MSPKKLIITIGFIFSALLALLNAGMTYNELYDRSNPSDSYPKKEAVQAGTFALIRYGLVTLIFAMLID